MMHGQKNIKSGWYL